MQEGLLDRGLKKTVDWRLIIVYLLIMFFGWLNIYAAVRSGEPSSIFDLGFNCGKQALWIAGAIVLAGEHQQARLRGGADSACAGHFP